MSANRQIKSIIVTTLVTIALMGCGRANSSNSDPAPTPAPTTTPTKKSKKIAKGNGPTAPSQPARPPVIQPAPQSTDSATKADATTLTTPQSLSSDYSRNCTGCHGQDGSGRINIRNKSWQEFQSAVRQGRGTMPSYSTSDYSDTNLKNDHKVLGGF